MSLGFLIPEFPGQTHAFFWREIRAIEDAGEPVRIFSTRRPGTDACPHDFREEATARTQYLFPPTGQGLRGILSRPAAAMRGSAYLRALSDTPPAGRARLHALLPSVADLVATCRARGIGHLHIHSCADAAHLGALARIMGGPRYSLTLHGDLDVYGRDHTAKFRRAAFVSAVTRPLAAEIAGVSPDTRAPVIWMGVDTGVFTPAERPPRAQGDPLRVISVARLNRTKGHAVFLAAMAALVAEGVDIRYRIVGAGPERDAIAAEIRRLGLGERVEMPGALGESAVRAEMAAADALALTSFGKGEAAPVTVMEAMASGLPVIVSRIGGTPDMITHGHDGLLTAQSDPGAVAEALRTLARDPERARALGRAARLSALEKFDYRANAARLLSEIRAANEAAQ